MSEEPAGHIEDFTRERLERRLRDIAREHFPGESLEVRELTHLVQVVTSGALLLTDLYTRATVGDILDGRGGEYPRSLRSILEGPEGLVDDPRLIYEVRRLPDNIKAVGDKALLDVGLIGQSTFQGIPLADLGPRAYHAASRILARLAEDPLLARFFKENRLSNIPLSDEVSFLEQCSHRFALYARVLGWLGSGEPGPERLAARGLVAAPARGTPSSSPPPPAVEPPLGGRIAVGEESPPVPPRPPAAPGGGAERLYLTQHELLAAYERILLFSALDISELAQHLSSRVIGQPDAIRALCDEFTLYAAGTQNLNRPPSYLFVGPTGVGKNHLVETLKEILEQAWGIEIPLLTLEGPNYTYPSDINELRGATRGFIRSDEEGILTEFHRRASTTPFSIILVDEVEKAHSQLRKFFLSIMDRGRVTDNRGHVLQFANSMLIYTSNIGYSDLARGADPIGYADRESKDRRVDQDARRDLRRSLSPEFVNRLKVVHFKHLDERSIDRILDLELARVVRRFQEVHGLEVAITDAARAEILRRGYSHDHGARHLRSHIETLINVEVSRKLKTEESRSRPTSSRVLRYLRGLKAGERKFELDRVRSRVMRLARARVAYRRVLVDYRDGGFVYTGADPEPS